jgi:5-(carboxyamino)imidazole ribonucleotide mutase
VSSAHRDPDRTAELARAAKSRGIKVIIAGAGLSAALPGAVSALTDLPVIGVPFASGPLNGLDALFAIAQLPSGVPVGTVGIDNAKNAAALAIRILNLAT